jgi:hypothetical protein
MDGGGGGEISGLCRANFFLQSQIKREQKYCGFLVLLARVLAGDDDTSEGLTDHDNSCNDLVESKPTATNFRDTLPLSSGLV